MPRHSFSELSIRAYVFDAMPPGGPKMKAAAVELLFPRSFITIEELVTVLRILVPRNLFPHTVTREFFDALLKRTLGQIPKWIPVSQFSTKWMTQEYSRRTMLEYRKKKRTQNTSKSRVPETCPHCNKAIGDENTAFESLSQDTL